MTTTSSGSTLTVVGSQGTSSAVPSGSTTYSDNRVRIGYLNNYVPSTSSSTVTSGITASSSGTTVSSSNTGLDPRYPGIIAPLAATNGLMFPYTPSINNQQDVDYSTMTMTHANTDYHFFNHVPNMNISISGKFTVQNYQEGIYALACIHFLRSVTKMYFGETDANNSLAGIPPPILQLNGYGTYMYNMVRVYVKSHSFTYDEGMDTVYILLNDGSVTLPAMFTLTVNLVVQNTTRAQRQDFSLDQFRSGALMANPPNSSGWI